ncbi:hypothetical protein [Mesorhizobium ventifaucium]|uniref:XRE family transcriptional regulator n=1 Tax=Mesorhizobium ventifaucium TaxID=666020 RepID=A0ABN8K623_9HYPH|nr:hypothetical protein [Mesorhizobium ventifaucium]CAH2404978.1 conserved hypothetical protein [Mesorhizobium ventifaucium]
MVHNLSWQEPALQDLQNSGMSYAEVGKMYGRSRATIIKLARLHELIRRVPISRTGLQRDADKAVISSYHRGVGLKVALLRKGRTYSEIAEELGVNRYVARTMELGVHEFTLSELMVLSERLGMGFDQMVIPPQLALSLAKQTMATAEQRLLT